MVEPILGLAIMSRQSTKNIERSTVISIPIGPDYLSKRTRLSAAQSRCSSSICFASSSSLGCGRGRTARTPRPRLHTGARLMIQAANNAERAQKQALDRARRADGVPRRRHRDAGSVARYNRASGSGQQRVYPTNSQRSRPLESTWSRLLRCTAARLPYPSRQFSGHAGNCALRSAARWCSRSLSCL